MESSDSVADLLAGEVDSIAREPGTETGLTPQEQRSLPFVSVIVPCYNEVDHIGACLDSILRSSYPPDRMEVLVVDGMSSDGTREILRDIAAVDPRVRLIDNPRRIKPVAFNLGVLESHGEVVMIMGAHSTYSHGYIELSVKYLFDWGADNVGGTRIAMPRENSTVALSILALNRSRFGLGAVGGRTSITQPTWVKTVFGGCYHRSVFDACGLFDERLLRGQDREFNYRIVHQGKRILMVPDVQSFYSARSDMRGHLKWAYAAGATPYYMARHLGDRHLISIRNVIPPLALAIAFALVVGGVWYPPLLALALAVSAVYLMATLSIGLRYAKSNRRVGLVVGVPLVFVLTHVAYALGAWVGALRPLGDGMSWAKD